MVCTPACIGTICSNTVLYIFKQYLSLTSACCCRGKCGIPPEIPYTTKTPTGSSSKSGGLKSWEIAVITIGGVLLLVLMGGMEGCIQGPVINRKTAC
ncbi:hypothetical protein pdam_00024959 [Pocillopora damicornis]|uniref:Uncharacterized protein n=1 Tax=Pocillopora damicornis TaxID=46731 RepID=A0A3M6U7P5_POCDA|nr:hypothetical protein pdam_00024959 [Pocillopora damicornis]